MKASHFRRGTLALSLFLVSSVMLFAQKNDPVVMTINGHPTTWSEFYYSYAKNGDQNEIIDRKTIDEYIPMYVDYRLKVEAAEEARLDTLKSFQDEYRLYRDLQLTPYLVDSAYIDSVAMATYQSTMAQFQGKELRRPAHIFIALKQNSSLAKQQQAKALIDSLYTELTKGADFAQLAALYTNDEPTVKSGGELPWIGPGMALPKFEEALYSLEVGQFCKPILTEAGYHIIKLLEKRDFGGYDEQRPYIIESLKSRGIEEVSAEHRISQIIAQSNSLSDREAVIDSVLQAHLDNLPLRYLVKEYHDGLLMFEVSQRNVWEQALNDSVALAKQYATHKKKYAWAEPRFKGYVYHYQKKSDNKKIAKLLKKYGDGNWRKYIHNTFNADSVTVNVSGPFMCKKGENPYVDQYAFRSGEAKKRSRFAYHNVVGKILKQPESYKDVKSEVVADLQEQLFDNWMDSLRKKYTVRVDEDLIKKLYKQEQSK